MRLVLEVQFWDDPLLIIIVEIVFEGLAVAAFTLFSVISH